MSSTTKYSLILTLDIGSSSIRCLAHQLMDESTKEATPSIKTIPEYTTVREISSVRPNTGKIILSHNKSSAEGENLGDASISLFDDIDYIIDEILCKLGEHFQVVGFGFSTFCMNLIGIDHRGRIIGEEATLSYACNDGLVIRECERLKKQLGIQKLHQLHQRTGAPLHASYALPQLISYYNQKETSGKQYRRVHKWQTLSSICLSRWIRGLSSEDSLSSPSLLPISYSEASWTGLLNFRLCEWDEECIGEILDEEAARSLPNVADYNDLDLEIKEFLESEDDENKTKRKTNKYWDRWPRLRSCRFVLGIGDGACANIGSKCNTVSRIAVTIGTSAAARVCIPLQINAKDAHHLSHKNEEEDGEIMVIPQGLFCYRIDKSHVLLGGALTDGGSVVDWIRLLLNLTCHDDFESCLQLAVTSYQMDVKQSDSLVHDDIQYDDIGLSQTNLIFIPFLSGERSIGFRGGANGCLLGLNRQSSPSDLVRACLEGVILRLHAILDLMKGRVNDSACIVVSGNALEKNLLWRRMLADCTGCQVVKDGDSNEGTSRGVAILVYLALNGNERTKDWSNTEENLNAVEIHIPDKTANHLWMRLKATQKDSIQCIAPLWK